MKTRPFSPRSSCKQLECNSRQEFPDSTLQATFNYALTVNIIRSPSYINSHIEHQDDDVGERPQRPDCSSSYCRVASPALDIVLAQDKTQAYGGERTPGRAQGLT